MGKLHVFYIMVISLTILIGNAQSNHFHCGKEKIAKFRVYIHGLTIGSNSTVAEAGRADATSISAGGLIRVANNLMTVEPDASSEELGRAQGFLISEDDSEESSVSMNLNFVFTEGEYEGSTLSVVGRKSTLYSDEEMPIVGGTGVFRWARGFSRSSSSSSSYGYEHEESKAQIGLLQFDMYAAYY